MCDHVSHLMKVFTYIYLKDYTDTMGSNSVETFIDSFGFWKGRAFVV